MKMLARHPQNRIVACKKQFIGIDILDVIPSVFTVFLGTRSPPLETKWTMPTLGRAQVVPRLFNSLEKLEKRIRRAEERKHGIQVTQLESLLATFFPNGTAQERHDNFLNFYIDNRNFIQLLLDAFDPLDFKFYILEE